MSSSLDRKIEAAKRRAEEERKARGGLSTDQFAHGNHDADGKVHPGIYRGAAPAPAPPGKTWLRSGTDWYEAGHPNLIYRTRDGLAPQSDGRNVVETLDKVVGTHTPGTVPGSVTAPEVGLHPKPQRMWVRDWPAWVDDNENQAAFYFTRNGDQPNEDMSNVVSTCATGRAYGRELLWHGMDFACIPPAHSNGKNAATVRRMFPDNEADQALALWDLVMFGAAYMKDGKRVDPRDVRIRGGRPVVLAWWDEAAEMPSGNFGQRQLPEIISNIKGRKRDESANPASGRIKLQQPHPLFKDPDARANITVGPGQQQRLRDPWLYRPKR